MADNLTFNTKLYEKLVILTVRYDAWLYMYSSWSFWLACIYYFFFFLLTLLIMQLALTATHYLWEDFLSFSICFYMRRKRRLSKDSYMTQITRIIGYRIRPPHKKPPHPLYYSRECAWAKWRKRLYMKWVVFSCNC